MQPRKVHSLFILRINMGLATIIFHASNVTGLVPKQEIGINETTWCLNCYHIYICTYSKSAKVIRKLHIMESIKKALPMKWLWSLYFVLWLYSLEGLDCINYIPTKNTLAVKKVAVKTWKRLWWKRSSWRAMKSHNYMVTNGHIVFQV